MLIDVRHHMASLVAVFFALGLGMLIGVTIFSGARDVEELRKLTDRLEAEFNRLQEGSRQLKDGLSAAKAEIRMNQEFGKAVLSIFVEERLAGLKIVVIGPQVKGETLSRETVDLLKSAGGQVIATFAVKNPEGLVQEEQPQEGTATPGTSGADAPPGELQAVSGSAPPTRDQFVSALAVAAVYGIDDPALAPFLKSGVVKDRRVAFERADIAVVVEPPGTGEVSEPGAAGRSGEADQDSPSEQTSGAEVRESTRGQAADSVSGPLVRQLLETGVFVAVVQPRSLQKSDLLDRKYKELLLVDNVDSVPGQIALVQALAQGARGHFGVKAGAKSLLPPLDVSVYAGEGSRSRER